MFLSGMKSKIDAYCDYWFDIVVSISIMAFIGILALLTVFLGIRAMFKYDEKLLTCNDCKHKLECLHCNTTRVNTIQ